MATQVSLNSGAVASAGALALQTNGTTAAITLDTSQNATFAGKVTSAGSLLLASNGTTTAATIDTSGNLGLGVTPSAWGSSYKVLQQSNYGSALIAFTSAPYTFLGSNWYNNGTNDLYVTSNSAGIYRINGDTHSWFQAASGTAGNAITFTQAMTLDASGNLGIGATSPAQTLHVKTSTAATPITLGVLSNATSLPALSFNGAYASTTMAGTYSLSGNLYTTVPSGSFQYWGVADAIKLTLDASGNLLVGTTSTSVSSTGFRVISADAGAGNPAAYISHAGTTNASGTGYQQYSTGASAYRFYVGYGGTIFATSTTITAISDQRLKENIRDLDDGLASVMALKPRKFDWKEGKGANIKDARGFIAQEFEAVFPDMIDEWRDPAPEGEEPYKAVNANLIPTLVKAIQELKAEFDAYKASHP